MVQARSEPVTAFHQLATEVHLSQGLAFRVAQDEKSVTNAWRAVYQAYRRAGLLEANTHRIYAPAECVGPQSAVICGCIGPLIASTLTVVADSDAGLRLDQVFAEKLEPLRREGRRLMEVGMFADRRKQFDRIAEALFYLSRYAFHFAMYNRVTDIVIGVHPRHADFYIRSLAFQSFGEARPYPAFNDQPVVLLRGNLEESLSLVPRHPVLEYFASNPINVDVFDQRFSFETQQLEGSPILPDAARQ